MTLLAAKYVTLNATTNIGGWQTKNLDAVRDGWGLYLHQETGGVFVVRNSEATYVSAITVMSCDLAEPLTLPKRGEAKELAAPAAPASPAKVAEGAKSLADEVLAELKGAPDGGANEGGSKVRAAASRRKRT